MLVASNFPTNSIILCFHDVGSASKLRAVIPISCTSRPVGLSSFQLEAFMFSVVKLQRWWKGVLLLKLMIKSAIIIQSCTRRWIARRKATVQKHHNVVIQVWYLVIVIYYYAVHLHFVCLCYSRAHGNLSLIYYYWFKDMVISREVLVWFISRKMKGSKLCLRGLNYVSLIGTDIYLEGIVLWTSMECILYTTRVRLGEMREK